METMNFATAINDILDYIVTDLLAEKTKEEGLLSDVAEVIRGDRHRDKPDLPAIWVFAETATVNHPPMAIAESWQLPVILSAIVKSDNIPKGYEDATDLAARARTVILKDRTLGARKYVQDVRSTRFEASAPWLRQGTLFASNAVITVIFSILER